MRVVRKNPFQLPAVPNVPRRTTTQSYTQKVIHPKQGNQILSPQFLKPLIGLHVEEASKLIGAGEFDIGTGAKINGPNGKSSILTANHVVAQKGPSLALSVDKEGIVRGISVGPSAGDRESDIGVINPTIVIGDTGASLEIGNSTNSTQVKATRNFTSGKFSPEEGLVSVGSNGSKLEFEDPKGNLSHGASGAPIVDKDGYIKSLVQFGAVNSNHIWGENLTTPKAKQEIKDLQREAQNKSFEGAWKGHSSLRKATVYRLAQENLDRTIFKNNEDPLNNAA